MLLVCYLDHDVLHPLGTVPLVQAVVNGARAQGYRVRLSPQTVYELAAAHEKVRNVRIETALKYCHEFTHLQPYQILAMEVIAIKRGAAVPPIPIEPIESLNKLRTNPTVLQTMGQYRNPNRRDLIESLDEVAAKIRSSPTLLEAARTTSFEEFYRAWGNTFLREAIRDAMKAAGIRDIAGAVCPPGVGRGLVTKAGLMLANIYRKVRNELRKGEGSISDLRGAIEASYGQRFLTRDVELYESLLLLKRAVENLPEPRLVRLSTDPPYKAR